MPSKKKKYNSRFPPARIKKIMQSDEEVGKVAQVVPIIISKALEIFVQSLLRSSSDITRSRNARTLTPNHIKTSILSSEEFKFLREIANSIPDVNPASEADDDESGAATPTTAGPQTPFQRRASAASTSGHQLSAAGQSAAVGFRTRGRPRKRLHIESQSSLPSMTSNEEPDDSEETEEDDDDDDEGDEEEEVQQSTNSDKNNRINSNQQLISNNNNNNHSTPNSLSVINANYYYSSSQTTIPANPSPYVSTIQSIAGSSAASLKPKPPVIEEDERLRQLKELLNN